MVVNIKVNFHVNLRVIEDEQHDDENLTAYRILR